jgi:hypothetical protein
MFYNGRNQRFYDIVWLTDFPSLLIAVGKINSIPREMLSEAIYFIWKRKSVQSSIKRYYLE